MKAKLEELIDIMKILRKKCPWDKEQTHKSLRRYLIEETYEVIEAIDEENYKKLKEELGDLLLQIVFHSEIADENNQFDIYDVIYEVCKKMKERHTHVFGKDNFSTPKEVVDNWDNIKMKERNIETVTEDLKSIPKQLPTLIRAYKVQQKAAKVGFDWTNADDAIQKIYEEISEFEKAKNSNDKSKTAEEIGDMLFAVVNVCRFFDIDPDYSLKMTIEKFISRFSYIEQKGLEIGKNLNEMTLEEMDMLWEEAKKI